MFAAINLQWSNKLATLAQLQYLMCHHKEAEKKLSKHEDCDKVLKGSTLISER